MPADGRLTGGFFEGFDLAAEVGEFLFGFHIVVVDVSVAVAGDLMSLLDQGLCYLALSL